MEKLTVEDCLKMEADAVQKNLTRFFQYNREQQILMLPYMFQYLQRHLSFEILAKLTDEKNTQQPFQDAVKLAFITPVKVGEEVIVPWTGIGTQVGMTSKGEIIGYTTRVEGEEKGDTDLFTKAATVKAFCNAALNVLGLPGLASLEGFEYMKARGFQYHLGSASEPAIMPSGDKVFVGCSNCHVTAGYRMGTVAGSRDQWDNSGFYDEMLSGFTVMYLEGLTRKESLRESSNIRLLRAGQ